ncbi:MAG: carbon monoxide dehydrogenase subunit G [Candidatus Dormibacteraeota bacterium]|uniref:Carbon monoxide dehydrogenase subunit G n=1 Tax=Candidatus Dormiibacter inghamiae TaxID=3127013 RepID=A0A934KGC3_9BACT|nr:carbon monoxide dehydrogenase subunit G [Candidatus Dormibacteraeota bacterium]MBJ7606372.1 carbon monoxide dehydrogenase subunit G [Candidatus Dormibacteraeota bacterium]
MKVTGDHSFSAERNRVWAALQDPQTLASTLPGVKSLEVTAPDRYAITAAVGVGAVKGTYSGTFAAEDKVEPEACVLRGSGRGSGGNVEVVVSVRLAERDGGGTFLTYDADATVTGALAGVGQRMVVAASRRTSDQFFSALDRVLTEGPAEQPTDIAAASSRGVPASAGTFFRPPAAGTDSTRSLLIGLGTGFLLALIGVAVGRRLERGSS